MRTLLTNSKAHPGLPRAVRAGLSARAPASAAPRPLREAEGELRRRVVVVADVVCRVACSGHGRSVRRHAQVREDAAHGRALGDDSDDPEPAVAPRAFENVDGETSAEQRRPVHARLHGVEYAPRAGDPSALPR